MKLLKLSPVRLMTQPLGTITINEGTTVLLREQFSCFHHQVYNVPNKATYNFPIFDL